MDLNFLDTLKKFILSKFLFSFIILIVGVLTARLLDVEDRGYYTLFFTTTALCSNFLHLGISQSCIFHLNKLSDNLGLITGNTLLYLIICSLILISSLVILYFFKINTPLGYLSLKSTVLVGLLTITLLWELCFSGLIYGTHQYEFQSKYQIFQGIMILLATIMIYPFGCDLDYALILRVLSIFTCTIIYVLYFLSKPSLSKLEIDIERLLKQLRFGVKNWSQNLIGFLNYKIYIFLLGIYSSNDSIAFFSISLIFAEIIRFLPDTIGTILLPKLSKINCEETSHFYTCISYKIMFIIGIFLIVPLMLFTKEIICFVFDSRYLESDYLIKLLLTGALCGVIYQILTRYFTSQGKQYYSIISSSIGLIVSILLCVILIPKYSYFGAGISFLSSTFFVSISMLFMYKKHANISLINLLFINKDEFLLIKKLLTSISFNKKLL